ncbi:polysialyltransferase family glycosyltransferase [Arthrobacter sp. JSM 101049]|uniref:polysialyltransferase family glycosyltransferase n=1 Tax=Arthrobacter sp. JSM 101049 TaxID=929097 RepID=UPI003566E3BF
MIQLLSASTVFQVASLAAMIDAGALPAAAGGRVLVLANGSQQPELTTRIQDARGFDALASRFDRVVDLAELLWPRRPAQFTPRQDELPLIERLLRSHWDLGDERLQLVVESIQVNPNLALCRIFHDASIIVHSDGLMSYGPTRNQLPTALRQRLDAIAYLDLVPGLQPVLLSEAAPAHLPVPLSALADVITELADAAGPTGLPSRTGATTALVLGQYLASLRLIDAEEEAALHRDMLLEARRRGATRVVFKPHPSAGPSAELRLASEAAALGLDFHVLHDPLLAETTALLLEPDLVVSCFSTALASIHYLFGTAAVAVGTDLLLERLAPYENSNRIPATLVDALFVRGTPPTGREPGTDDGSGSGSGNLQQLVEAVAYCMQSHRLPHLRASAVAFLAAHHASESRYFKRRRLTKLGLPGGLPDRHGHLRFAARLRRSVRRRGRTATRHAVRFARARLGSRAAGPSAPERGGPRSP